MITFKQFIVESEVVTLKYINSVKDLIDPKTGKCYTGEVNVTGDVYLSNEKLRKLPVKFGKVGGVFFCHDNQLTSLAGAPSSANGFFCSRNQLTSLEGAPSSVDGDFGCERNNLTSLAGAPSSANEFFCGYNKLTSLEGIHKIIKRMDGVFQCAGNPIKSGGIGLILIEGLSEINADQPAFEIISKYLGQGKKGLLLCQDELIEAGYEEFAKL